jgi:hypothetical protein
MGSSQDLLAHEAPSDTRAMVILIPRICCHHSCDSALS